MKIFAIPGFGICTCGSRKPPKARDAAVAAPRTSVDPLIDVQPNRIPSYGGIGSTARDVASEIPQTVRTLVNEELPACPLSRALATPVASFDDFLAEGSALEDFVWETGQAQSLCIRDIREWARTSKHSSLEEADPAYQVVVRRTDLWKMVLGQHFLASDATLNTPFTVSPNSTLATSPPKYTLLPSGPLSRPHCPLQRIHISPYAIPPDLADLHDLDASEMLAHLNAIFGTSVPFTPEIERYLTHGSGTDAVWDVGMAYGHLRPWWTDLASGEMTFMAIRSKIRSRDADDRQIRQLPSGFGSSDFEYTPGLSIVNLHIPPRRVWDLYSNRVLPFSAVRCNRGSVPDTVWAVSHSWVGDSERHEMWSSVNGRQWPIPLPRDINLDQVRIELLNMGAEYVFLDILCLRQMGKSDMEPARLDEWKLDVPTMGHIYSHHPYQTVVIYFNGLGRPFTPSRDLLESSLHWFNRAWTLQETSFNWLPGGLTASNCHQWDGKEFMRRMRESQQARGLLSAERPRFSVLLDAMQRRPGYASKKPYDRVAALSYLIPGHRPEPYSERFADAEDAWMALVATLNGHERLYLLLLPQLEDTALRSISWRPSWREVQLARQSHAPPDLGDLQTSAAARDFDDELLQEHIIRPRGVISRWYYHKVYIVTGCYLSGSGQLFAPMLGRFKPCTIDLNLRTPTTLNKPGTPPFALVSLVDHEYWIVCRTLGYIKLWNGELAVEVRKLEVCRVKDREQRNVLTSETMGSISFVAYRDGPLYEDDSDDYY